MSASFALGQRVRMTGTIDKVREGYGPIHTRYEDAPLPGSGIYGDNRRYEDGIIVGKRTVAEGRTHYNSYEPPVFIPSGYCEVWLVAFHLRRKPVMCSAEQLEVAA